MTPLNEQAYNYLQKLIMENHFSYQEVYSETKLSKELEIILYIIVNNLIL